MRRWNGWGDDGIKNDLSPAASRFLEQQVGAGKPSRDASLDEVLSKVPASRLPSHPLVTTDSIKRLTHARGQSLPDWIALRSGHHLTFPDGVANPLTESDVHSLIQYAQKAGASLIPYGGGTSVVGHINPISGEAPVLTVDMSRMNRLLRFDESSHLATFGAGVAGPDLEAQLRARGYTLGHFPQSFDYSTLGGWIATRSSGQQSLAYGRIERLFAGGRLVSPAGTLFIPSFPASAAGPDLREMVLGSEGRLGILTEASVRVSPLPQREEFHAVFFPEFEHGQEAVREILWAGLPLSMLRLSTPEETETSLALAGHENLISAMERLLSMRGVGQGKCMLLLGYTGTESMVKFIRKESLVITSKHHGIHVGRTIGTQWHKNRFRTPYLRNILWEMGYAVDTVETAATWENVSRLVNGVDTGMRSALADIGEQVHVFTHLSHLYPHGSSVYTTYLYRIASDCEETLRRWQVLKELASQLIQANGGTISHQHGVGADHSAYLPAEKGAQGIDLICALCKQLDPQGMMNPGKLVL